MTIADPFLADTTDEMVAGVLAILADSPRRTGERRRRCRDCEQAVALSGMWCRACEIGNTREADEWTL